MNLLVTLDTNYIPPLCVMLKSIMRSNPNTDFDLFVAHSSLTEKDFEKIDASIDRSRTTVHPIKVDPEIFNDAPVLKRISKETYFRLLAMEYMPKDVDRVLYIDPDTVVINPLDGLYSMDMGDALFAGAGHTKGIVEWLNRMRLHMRGQYVNAGILLINLERMRETVTAKDIFDYVAKHGKKLYLADQDVLNGMFSDHIIRINPCLYNLDEKTFKNYSGQIDIGWVRDNTVIVHFNGCYKPWKEKYVGVLDCFYFKYEDLRSSEFVKYQPARIA